MKIHPAAWHLLFGRVDPPLHQGPIVDSFIYQATKMAAAGDADLVPPFPPYSHIVERPILELIRTVVKSILFYYNIYIM